MKKKIARAIVRERVPAWYREFDAVAAQWMQFAVTLGRSRISKVLRSCADDVHRVLKRLSK